MSTRIKTLKGWEKSGLDLDKYLTEPCRINKALANYICECVAPKYCSQEFTQGGDPEKSEHGVLFYFTVSHISGIHWYIGVLPEFKQ